MEIAYADMDNNDEDHEHDDNDDHENDVHDSLQDESALSQDGLHMEADPKNGGAYVTVNHGHTVEIHRVDDGLIEDRNYSTYAKPANVEIFDEELPYDQNGSSMGHHSQPLRNFTSAVASQNQRLRYDRDLVDFQKQLMQREFDEVRAMRQEKHKIEMEILSAELKHKYIEHQKKLEILNKRILDI